MLPRQFGGQESVSERMFFLIDADDRAVGTATAWFDATEEGGIGPVGRVHWVALTPSAQGKGLAKPMLSAVLRKLHEEHESVVLRTHTQAARAVGMYLQMGFVPAPLSGSDDISGYTQEEGEGWKLLAAHGVPVAIPGTDLE